ncbi:G3P acyltransferase [Anaerohalosphaera lusitana]|uniref:Glycerol-3-phosphate acyltransferase n=1 Tax=Anaerohalosphaera lusitana TaxID=1936003 RepID=A0A1U9NN53_9BACT|nr:glycerol-3-phosphate 1-O-acyltransferase PlsY [Anaerohalosphaera lusitana]AQT68946.1 G3P acyltransferase [Anaerohalosphaera lusitana]
MNPSYITFIVASYLIGSIPFGVLIAKAHGKDLRKIGSGNIGATNVSRALGKNWAYICFALDVLKGLAPTLAFSFVIERPPSLVQLWVWLAVGAAAVIGHIFPIYLRFKGGKGVSTSLGMILGLYPYYTMTGLLVFVIWTAAVLAWNYVSLASIIAACCFPLILLVAMLAHSQWDITQLWPLIVAAVVMSALVILRHRTNIKRLFAGTENKIMQKKTE